MIARHEAQMNKTDLWAKLAAPLPPGVISWRPDGKPSPRNGQWFARYVAYIEANTVRERLDLVCAGEWDLTLELLPALAGTGDEAACSFKARLQILGVIREDVGTGKDYKQASTDAFKRAAVRFGIGHELYAYEQNWVQVDGDGKYAKALEDPQTAYTRRYGGGSAAAPSARPAPVAASSSMTVPDEAPTSHTPAPEPATVNEQPSCPKCAGRMFDNRLTKRNPKAPDFKCRDRSCDGVIWPPKPAKGGGAASTNGKEAVSLGGPIAGLDDALVLDSSPLDVGLDDIPF